MDMDQARKILEIPLDSDIEVEEMLKLCNAFWIYGGIGPHAELSKGPHSDGYFNLNEATKFSNFCHIFASRLFSKLKNIGIKKVDVIVSSSLAAIPIGQAVAYEMNAISVFTEKKGDGQVYPERFEIPDGAVMLHVEELITSMNTTQSVHNAILNAQFLGIIPNSCEFIKYNGKPLVATIIHRPVKLPIDYPDFEVLSLYEREVKSWNPAICPLCQAGSKAMKPKANWQEFMKYQK